MPFLLSISKYIHHLHRWFTNHQQIKTSLTKEEQKQKLPTQYPHKKNRMITLGCGSTDPWKRCFTSRSRGSILAGALYLSPKTYISADSDRLAAGLSTSTFSNNWDKKKSTNKSQQLHQTAQNHKYNCFSIIKTITSPASGNRPRSCNLATWKSITQKRSNK